MNEEGVTTERIRSGTPDLVEERLRQLADIVPEAFVDGALDIDRLMEALGETESTGEDRYRFTWAGRNRAFAAARAPNHDTLVPAPSEAVGSDRTRHVFIEGDNLDTLKLLYRSYFERVKLIYIDPPYNTGKDFVYRDNFRENVSAYLEATGQHDTEGRALVSNPETSGRYHSAWLTMMYPRLFLARQLLRADGLLFVSIDDTEVHHLRILLDEIFGDENRVADLVWRLGTGTTAGHFRRSHEYILCYARDKTRLPNFVWRGGGTVEGSALKKISRLNPASRITFPAGLEYAGDSATFEGTLGGVITQTVIDGPMRFENGRLTAPVTLEAGWAMRHQIESWIAGEETYDTKGQKVLRFYFDRGGLLRYEKERTRINPKSVLEDVGSTKTGTDELQKLGFERGVFPFPKPSRLVRYLVKLTTDPTGGDIVMDFFAGSGTTGQAVLEQNRRDGGDRRFVLVQLAEPVAEDQPAYEKGYSTIAEIAKERLTRVVKGLASGDGGRGEESGGAAGFRVFKQSPSHQRVWMDSVTDNDPAEYARQLEAFADSLKPGWTEHGLIAELALREGLGLDYAVDSTDAPTGTTIHRVEDADQGLHFFACFDDSVPLADVEWLDPKPDDLFICRDTAVDDATASNIAALCRFKTL